MVCDKLDFSHLKYFVNGINDKSGSNFTLEKYPTI
jgi:hypothetical protein